MRIQFSALFLSLLVATLGWAATPQAVETELVVLRLQTEGTVRVQADDETVALEIPNTSRAVHAVVGPTGLRYDETEIDFPDGMFPLEALQDVMPEGLAVRAHPTLVTRSGEPASMSIGATSGGTMMAYNVVATETGEGHDVSIEIVESGPGFNNGIPLTVLRVGQPLPYGDPLIALRQVSPGEWLVVFVTVRKTVF